MILLGLRLTLQSGREAALRLLVTAAAVALGVGLFLMALAGVNGLHAQTDRGAWLDTAAQTPRSTSGTAAPGRLWWMLSADQFGNRPVDRIDLAATGPGAPVPPGIPHLPRPGEFYASPALATLIKSVPASELRDRFPGHQIGTIGAAALPSPNSLIIVIGRDARQLSQVPGAVEVRGIQQTPSSCYACQSGAGVGSGAVLQWILVGGAVALLLPVLILIATASRLSAARREERFAAMRLVGAMPRQVSVIAAVEATVAAIAGVAVGFALFFLFRPLLTHVPFTGAPLAPGDLSLHWEDIALVVIGVPIAAVVSAWLALRRVQISPLGVSRRASSAPPRIFRIIPLLAGIALLAYFDAAGKPSSNSGQLLELLLGFVLLMVGLVLAGPWLTTAGSRLMANRASRPATLIAGRRLLDNPRAAFRFISGLVLALFVTSAAIGALSSIVPASGSQGDSAGKSTLADLFCSYSSTGCPAVHRSSFRLKPGAGRAPHDARGARCDGDAPEPVPRSAAGHRGSCVRPAGKDACDRQVCSGCDERDGRLLPSEHPWEQLAFLLDGVAVRAPVGGGLRQSSRQRSRRRHGRIVQLARTGTDVAREGVSLSRSAGGGRGAPAE